MRRLSLLPLFLLVCLLAPAAASAGPFQLSLMQDDDRLLYRSDQVRDDTLKRMKALGVDAVRVTVLWEVVAEDAKKTKARRKRFKGDNPATYPSGNWDRYDRLVRAGRTLGVNVLFNVTGPGPSWAHGKAPKSQRRDKRTWKPKAREYFKFVTALGKRYSGAYRDENDGQGPLPRVDTWSIWNEPNQPGWLMPQWEKGKPYAPRAYRELWYFGRLALDATGHGDDTVLIGETAPLGSNAKRSRSPLRPKAFMRELFCVNGALKPFTGSAASKRGCRTLTKIGKFKTSAWAHHPYTKDLPPNRRDSSRDSITMANVAELGTYMDLLGKATGRIDAGKPTIMTEFGYETNPPDPFAKTTLAQQAQYLVLGDYLAYREPRVLGNTQFQLYDVLPNRRAKRGSKKFWFTYQSGLYFADGKAKPALPAYTFPFLAVGRGTDSTGAQGISVWGQLRPVPNFTKQVVRIEYRAPGSTTWTPAGPDVQVTNPFGYFEAVRAVPATGSLRAVFQGVPSVESPVPAG